MKKLMPMVVAVLTLAPITSTAQESNSMNFVVYEPGPGWNSDMPPEEQDLGAHFGFVGEQTSDGQLRAFGMRAGAVQGYYLLNSADGVEDFIESDPAATSGVLSATDTIGWTVLFDNLATVTEPVQMTVLWYEPGEAWLQGKPLFDQEVGAHVSYIQEQASKGNVIMGGPRTSGNGGIYLTTETDPAALQAFLDADPGVTSGLFAPKVMSWMVLGSS